MLLGFAFDGQPETDQLIAAVLEHPRWRDDCMSSWTRSRDVHGPYQLETIGVKEFQQCTIATTWKILVNWPVTDINPWAGESLLQSREILGAWVAPPLLVGSDQLYQLAVPREGNEHEVGWVVGKRGFHEFIAIERERGTLTVISATDD